MGLRTEYDDRSADFPQGGHGNETLARERLAGTAAVRVPATARGIGAAALARHEGSFSYSPRFEFRPLGH